MADKRDAVINAYSDLAQSLTRASLAVIDYANALRVASDPAPLISNPPAILLAIPEPKFGQEGEVDGKKAKKSKKPKDPNAPKRPASAYLEFQNSVRQKFRDEDPGLPYSEVLRKIADVWAKMTDDDKKPFTDIVADKAAAYEEAKKTYKPSDDIPVDALSTTLGKDGKEYSGKKRGRKSNAEKAALGVSEPEITKAIEAASHSEKKSSKKDKSPTKKPVKAPSVHESSDESSSDDESSDSGSSSSESEPIPEPKKKAKKESSHKHKKSKH
ncbi:hypothetical protein OIO90_001202 [Microbotryomycetes sp. JL221]|nr:hypothetical protein OIO90_001202 [Microbotryomycetes sp. JL221]